MLQESMGSWMDRTQRRKLEDAQNERAQQQADQQRAQFQALLPVVVAKAKADQVSAHNQLAEQVVMQGQREAASNLVRPAQEAFGNITKITDVRQRALAGMDWVNNYGQLANVAEYAKEFNDKKSLAAQMFADYKTHELLSNQLKIQTQKTQTPLVRNAQAYADAVAAGDDEMAGMIKARMDKDSALFTPADKNEYLMLTHALTNPPPGVDPSVITARMEQLAQRTINTAPAGGAAPAQQPPAQPGAPAAPAAAPAPIATAGAPRITPANKTKAQEDVFKLQSLVHQGVDVLNSLEGHPEYLGVRGQAGSVIADSLLPAMGIGTGDQGRVSARQKIGIFRDSLLKTIADLPRVSQAEISDIKSNLPDTGWGSNLAADTTKLRNVLQLLGRKAQEESKRLGVAPAPQ